MTSNIKHNTSIHAQCSRAEYFADLLAAAIMRITDNKRDTLTSKDCLWENALKKAEEYNVKCAVQAHLFEQDLSLPPVGSTEAEYEVEGVIGLNLSRFEVVAHRNGKAIVWATQGVGLDGVTAYVLDPWNFIPLERHFEELEEEVVADISDVIRNASVQISQSQMSDIGQLLFRTGFRLQLDRWGRTPTEVRSGSPVDLNKLERPVASGYSC